MKQTRSAEYRKHSMSSKDRAVKRQELVARDGGQCFYCDKDLVMPVGAGHQNHNAATLDHIIPRSKGGSNRLTNLVLACQSCNDLRADMPVAEFVRLIVECTKKDRSAFRAVATEAREERT